MSGKKNHKFDIVEKKFTNGRLLLKDFSFGFELEGTYDSNRIGRDGLHQKFTEILGIDGGQMHDDGSLRTCDSAALRRFDSTFEFSSPVIPYSIDNIKKFIKLMDSLPELNVRVNRSCGFHTHISYKNMKSEDLPWIFAYMIADDSYKSFLKLGRTNFYTSNGGYARADFLEDAKNFLIRENYSNFSRCICRNEKYRCMHIHSQGTFEWRGPRTFLISVKHSKNVAYIKKLTQLMLKMCEALNSDKLKTGITRKEFMSNMYCDEFSFRERNTTRLDALKERILSSPSYLNHISEKSMEHYREELNSLATDSGFKNSLIESFRKNNFEIKSENALFSFFNKIFNSNYAYLEFVSVDFFRQNMVRYGKLHRLTSIFEYLMKNENVNQSILESMIIDVTENFGASRIRTFSINAVKEMCKYNINVIKTIMDKNWIDLIGEEKAKELVRFVIDTAKYDIKTLGIYNSFINSPNKELFLDMFGYNRDYIATSQATLNKMFEY